MTFSRKRMGSRLPCFGAARLCRRCALATLFQAASKPSGFGMRYLHRHWPGINPPLLQTAALPAGQLMEQGGEPCAEQKL